MGKQSHPWHPLDLADVQRSVDETGTALSWRACSGLGKLGRVLINGPAVSAFGETRHRADIAE
jgi:hypothetical protein